MKEQESNRIMCEKCDSNSSADEYKFMGAVIRKMQINYGERIALYNLIKDRLRKKNYALWVSLILIIT
ncbi:hypothetical protein BH10BAC2_BH10BAC2_39730 [soil metagenome]